MPLSRSIRSLARRIKTKILRFKRWIPNGKDVSQVKLHVSPCMCSEPPHVTNGCVVSFLTEGEYKPIPNELWAWKLRRRKRMVCEQCEDCKYANDCQHICSAPGTIKCHRMEWAPELLSPSGSLRTACKLSWLLSYPSSPPPSSAQQGVFSRASHFTPEIFERICCLADDVGLERICRRVRRYTLTPSSSANHCYLFPLPAPRDLLAPPRELRNVNVGRSKQMASNARKMEDSWPHRLALCQHLHEFTIEGPLPRHKTIRSIHFVIPRSLPSLFSQAIWHLSIKNVQFRCFEDTTRLVSELPRLKDLWLNRVTWKSLPTELPRKRSLASRNHIWEVDLWFCKVKGAGSSSLAFAVFTLFYNVYSTSSFFPSDILPAIQSVLQIILSTPKVHRLQLKRGSQGRMNSLTLLDDCSRPLLALRTCNKQLDSESKSSLFVFVRLQGVDVRSDRWTQLNDAVALLPQKWRPLFLFGWMDELYGGRATNIWHFSAKVVHKKLPSLIRRGKVRYAMALRESRDEDQEEYGAYWYALSLDSDVLTGEGLKDPWNVYKDWSDQISLNAT